MFTFTKKTGTVVITNNFWCGGMILGTHKCQEWQKTRKKRPHFNNFFSSVRIDDHKRTVDHRWCLVEMKVFVVHFVLIVPAQFCTYEMIVYVYGEKQKESARELFIKRGLNDVWSYIIRAFICYCFNCFCWIIRKITSDDPNKTCNLFAQMLFMEFVIFLLFPLSADESFFREVSQNLLCRD